MTGPLQRHHRGLTVIAGPNALEGEFWADHVRSDDRGTCATLGEEITVTARKVITVTAESSTVEGQMIEGG